MRVPPWLAGPLAAALLIALLPATALAHASLRSADPAAGERLPGPPGDVRLVLSAPVEDEFLLLEVTDRRGDVVSGPVRRAPGSSRVIVAPVREGARGPLVVRWRALARDGHVTGGAFGLGAGAAAPEPGEAVVPARSGRGPLTLLARLLVLGAPLGLLGLVGLAAAVAAPAVRAGGVVAPGEPRAEATRFREAAAAALAGAAAGWWRAWWALVAAGAAGLLLAPVATLRELREGPRALGDLLVGTRAGAAWWAGVACLALAALAGLALRSRGRGRTPASAGWAIALGAPPAVALAVLSWSGHASSGGDRTANIVIDALHNGATALWIGGLLGLVTLALPAVAALGEADRVRLAAGVVVRFSAIAMAAVATLVVTGVYRALAEASLADLLDTGYGRALVVKLALFAVLLVGGAYNRMIVHPRLERAALGLDPDDRGAGAALRTSVRAELIVAAALLVSVAVLVSLPPPV
ncbi:CopD family protein [Miltoncostaea marina]|uniref:copper resistance CopC/CopD family protein n=1 Tax=Miltoncostaea marina TaxID=2843215 RepID=UPI001C3E3DEA|nr:CopD family protein [Miltoncostaea marina]